MAANIGSLTCEVPVFYSTNEGQTRRIAIRIATVLHDLGLESRAIDIADVEPTNLDWTYMRGAFVGASIHLGKHQRKADAFVRAHAEALNLMPSAFFSVSLAAASKNQAEVEAAKKIATAFPAERGWAPTRIASIAGRLAYREYGFFIRWIMKRIASKEGAPTDTSRDYELTQWDQVDALAREMARQIHARVAVA